MLLVSAAAWCFAAAPLDGAALYKKHCAVCHPDTSRLALDDPLAETLREPPPGMPAYGEDKLSELEARAIESYLLKGRSAEKQPEAQLPPPKKADPAPKALEEPGTTKKKSWMKGFGTEGL